MRRTRMGITNVVTWALLMVPLTVAAESSSCIISAGDYQLQQTSEGSYSIKMADATYSYIQSPGNPSLPEKIIDIKVPLNYDLSDLTLSVTNVQSTTLEGCYEIVPQPPLTNGPNLNWGENILILGGKNKNVYTQNEVFPKESIELLPYSTNLETESVSGKLSSILMKRIRIRYSPFQYNPITGKLIITNKATVTVRYNKKETTVLTMRKALDEPPKPGYAIITTNEIVDNSKWLANFVTMKEQQGVDGQNVYVVTEDDFDHLTGQAPNGRAEKIRKWLQDNYILLNIQNVLLIGNPDPDDPYDPADAVGDIPMKMCYPEFYSYVNRNCPTDMFYSDLIGNWDFNGDQIYGVAYPSTYPSSPDPAIDPTTFSARWTGKLLCDYDGDYRFSIFCDDGVKLWIDENLVINDWTDHPPTIVTGNVSDLSAGQHDIRLEYYQNLGHSTIYVLWSKEPEMELEGIAPDHLLHYDAATHRYVPGGLDVVYFNNMDLTGTSITSMDNSWGLRNIWSNGDIDPDYGMKTAYQVAVGRIPLYTDNYEELDDILIKIIRYESSGESSIGWRKSILLPMNPLSPSMPNYYLGEAIKTGIAIPNLFSSFRIYDEDYSGLIPPGPTPDLHPCIMGNVITSWINGSDSRGMVTWLAHGTSTGSVDIIRSSLTVELDNAKPSFTFQASCLNGCPEDENNLGYALLKHGAIATVSASRVSWGGGETNPNRPNNPFNDCIAYAYTKFVINNGLPAGKALGAFKADVAEVNLNLMTYNLYGDPDCYLLTVFPNQPPVANAGGPYAVPQGSSSPIHFDASGSSDPEGEALEYRWDYDNDGDYTEWSTDPYLDLSMCGTTTETVVLEVRDARGMSAVATATYTFYNVNPVADAGEDQTVNEGTEVTFNGSFTEPGCESHIYEWDFNDLSPVVSGTLTPVHSYADNGLYNTELIVTDYYGGTGTDAVQITVNNVAPTVTINTVTPATIRVGDVVNFSGSFSDPGWLDNHTSSWNFGDGTSAPGTLTEENIQPFSSGTCQATKTYTAAGVYNVILTVTDDDGGITAATRTITVIGFQFNVTPNPVPRNAPVSVSYTIPPAYAGATVKIVEHHQWYNQERTEFNQVPLSGTAGLHTYSPIWFWTKGYFGTASGPYLIELKVNGVVVDQCNLNFAY